MSDFLYKKLHESDPEVNEIIEMEEKRQRDGLELIASENYTSISVLQANASCLTNKYSEGTIGARYYGGTENIDLIESLCHKRALKLFGLDPEIWGVNVQPLSGSAANLAVYTGLLGKDGKLMGLDLNHGGHLTHGYQTSTKKVSASSMFFNSRSYYCGSDYLIDYDELRENVKEFDPSLLICGGSAYPRDFDYKKLREIIGEKYLMLDMAHISGFIATGLMNNGFDYADVVTTTTHKILRGPRSGMIFYRKKKFINGVEINIKQLIDSAVFPGLQGGPHNQKIAALCVALKQADTEEYKEYCRQVKSSAQLLGEELQKCGYEIITGGTDCHMILVKLGEGLGEFGEKLCDLVKISVNKNTIVGDLKPMSPSAVRIGTCALTTRGFKSEDFIKVSSFLDKAFSLAREFFEAAKKLFTKKTEIRKCFLSLAASDKRVSKLRNEVIEYSKLYPIPLFNLKGQ